MPEWTQRFDGQWEIVSPLSDEQIARIPGKRGVALLAGEGDRPIQLLPAANLRARVRNRLRRGETDKRSKTPDLLQVTRKVFWKLASGHFETDLLFFDLSSTIWPKSYTRLLAWKPGWFLSVDLQEAYPHFVRTREVFESSGRYFGPFPDARSAERFIKLLEDAFALCRDAQCLAKAPHGQPCTYGQMGKCLSPCDGTIGAPQYGRVVAEAAAFAAGRHEALRQRLTESMTAAADELKFEFADSLKAKINRLREFDRPAYAYVGPAEEFRFLSIHPGTNSQEAKIFLADRGRVEGPYPAAYPPEPPQLARVLEQMRALAGADRGFQQRERWRMGLVVRYLFSGEARRGLMLPWREGMTADALAEAIESGAGVLRLRPPKRRARTDSPEMRRSHPE